MAQLNHENYTFSANQDNRSGSGVSSFFKPTLKRQLSVEYSFNGELTADDPSGYVGDKRVARESAILAQYPHSGYAEAILVRRRQADALQTSEQDNTNKNLSQSVFHNG